MSEHVMEFSDANFQSEVLNSDIPVLVDFWAEWCGPCRALAPTVEAVAEGFVGKLKVGKVDVDSNPNVAGQFGIRSIPTILLFKGGENVAQLVGNVSKNAIEDMVNSAV